MRIICTIKEFANMVRDCHDSGTTGNCEKCAIYHICYEYDGDITQFVEAADIVDEQEDHHAPD